jgi:hypothetical protein
VAGLSPDDTLTVLGVPQTASATRWLPGRTASNQFGWISEQYIVPVGQPLAVASPSPDVTIADALLPPTLLRHQT